MPFSEEDKALVKNLHLFKGYGSRRLLSEFQGKNWTKGATPAFISPDLWPPNSPDLNPVDYKIGGVMQQRLYETRVDDVEELKRRLVAIWADMEQSVIDDAIESVSEASARLHSFQRGTFRTCTVT